MQIAVTANGETEIINAANYANTCLPQTTLIEESYVDSIVEELYRSGDTVRFKRRLKVHEDVKIEVASPLARVK